MKLSQMCELASCEDRIIKESFFTWAKCKSSLNEWISINMSLFSSLRNFYKCGAISLEEYNYLDGLRSYYNDLAFTGDYTPGFIDCYFKPWLAEGAER